VKFCECYQKWIEPKKGIIDLVAGVPFGMVGSAVGAAHYLAEGLRHPVCSNVIKGHGAKPQLPIQGFYPPQLLNQEDNGNEKRHKRVGRGNRKDFAKLSSSSKRPESRTHGCY
jgi:hypothetical protein